MRVGINYLKNKGIRHFYNSNWWGDAWYDKGSSCGDDSNNRGFDKFYHVKDGGKIQFGPVGTSSTPINLTKALPNTQRNFLCFGKVGVPIVGYDGTVAGANCFECGDDCDKNGVQALFNAIKAGKYKNMW